MEYTASATSQSKRESGALIVYSVIIFSSWLREDTTQSFTQPIFAFPVLISFAILVLFMNETGTAYSALGSISAMFWFSAEKSFISADLSALLFSLRLFDFSSFSPSSKQLNSVTKLNLTVSPAFP